MPLKLLAALCVALLLVMGFEVAAESASSCQPSTAEMIAGLPVDAACSRCEAPMNHGKMRANCAVSCASAVTAVLPALPFLSTPGDQTVFPQSFLSLPSLAAAPEPFPPRGSAVI